MSAVIDVDRARGEARSLPLVEPADAARPIAWRDGRAVGVAAFLADVARVADALPAGRPIVNLCEDRYAFLVAFCASLVHGQPNLLPPSRAPHAIDEVLAAHPDALTLGDGEFAACPLGHLRMPPLVGAAEAPSRESFAVSPVPASLLATVGFTSGSTGHPKPNPKTWDAFRASTAQNVRTIAAALDLAPGTFASVVATVPPQHMYGLELSVLLPLLGPFAVSSSRPLFPADVAAALAAVPAPRVLVTTPVHLRALMRDGVTLPPIAAIVSATAPLSRELAAEAEARCGAPLVELFGSTETCVIAQRSTAREDAWTLYPEVELRPQPDGTLVAAPYLAKPVPLHDVVELLPGAQFRVCGRNSDLLEIAGKRASLADLTRRLLAVPGVVDGVVFQHDDHDSAGVRRIVALVVAPERSEAELLAALRQAIDPVFLPRPLRRVASLPRNETGKLPRAELLAALRPTS